MNNPQNYISQIKSILDKTGWTQAEFAQELGVTFATVNRWINGHTTPHSSQIKQISRIFKEVVGIVPLSAQEIKSVLACVDAQKRKFKDVKRFLQQEKIADEFVLELTYHSDAIEGSTMTKKETEAVIFDRATVKDRSLTEHLEAAHHAAVLKEILKGTIGGKISEEMILSLHYSLMHGIRDDAGQYSKLKRGIRGVDLALPHPEDIPYEMKIFIRQVNAMKGHTIEHVSQMHADFEAIHPFGDGNGRVGRFLMIIQLLTAGYPPCVVTLNEKARYYEALDFAQQKSSSHLVSFIADSVLKGYEIVEKYL